MFRLFPSSAGRRTVAATTAVASSTSTSSALLFSSLFSGKRFQADTASTAGKDVSIDTVWSLWNEGNLFSLSAADLSQFLTKQNVVVDAAWKKAALVRQVEDVLRAREAKRKTSSTTTSTSSSPSSQQQQQQQQAAPSQQKESDVYGRWEGQQGGGGPGGAAAKSEMLLDLSASGFYSSQSTADATAAAVPKAFQLFTGSSTPDVVLSRVNTTSFPGFAANAECFTFVGADAAQSTKSRYSKTTQWSILNARHMNLNAEIVADLGKLVLRSDIVKKNRYVVSSFALQQRVQHSQTLWVSSTSADAVNNNIESILKSSGFSVPTNKELTFDAKIRRKNDTILAELDSKGATTGVFSGFTNIQTAYWMAPTVGQDVRFLVRTRKSLLDPNSGDAGASEYLKSTILDVSSDEAKSLLKPNLGEIIYASENETRVFEKKFDSYSVKVKETTRQPLIISREEEDGLRTELSVVVSVPMNASADKFDLPSVTGSVYELAVELAKAANDGFVSEFGLSADPVVTSASSSSS